MATQEDNEVSLHLHPLCHGKSSCGTNTFLGGKCFGCFCCRKWREVLGGVYDSSDVECSGRISRNFCLFPVRSVNSGTTFRLISFLESWRLNVHRVDVGISLTNAGSFSDALLHQQPDASKKPEQTFSRQNFQGSDQQMRVKCLDLQQVCTKIPTATKDPPANRVDGSMGPKPSEVPGVGATPSSEKLSMLSDKKKLPFCTFWLSPVSVLVVHKWNWRL